MAIKVKERRLAKKLERSAKGSRWFLNKRWLSICLAMFIIVTAPSYLVGAWISHRIEEGIYVDFLRDHYIPDYYARIGRWPSDLKGTRTYMQHSTSKYKQRWDEIETHSRPTLTVIKITKTTFAARLEFNWLFGSTVNLDIDAATMNH